MLKLNRRRFVLGTVGTVGALVVGWSALPARQRLTPSEPSRAGSPRGNFRMRLPVTACIALVNTAVTHEVRDVRAFTGARTLYARAAMFYYATGSSYR
jgi:hypothetical protein